MYMKIPKVFSAILFLTATKDSEDEQKDVYDIQIEVESSKAD